jgi:hypothetical protein
LITPESSQVQENGVAEAQLPHHHMSMIVNSPPFLSPNQSPGLVSQNNHENALTGSKQADSAIGRPSTPEKDLLELTQGEIVVDAEQYEYLMDFLLQTDFAGEELAAENSRGWINKTLEISKASAFGYSIRGELVLAESSQTGPENPTSQPINVLTNLRKKRKADQVDAKTIASVAEREPLVAPVNTLPTALVRKKAKS